MSHSHEKKTAADPAAEPTDTAAPPMPGAEPTAEQIEKLIEGQKRVQETGMTLVYLSSQAQSMVTGVCSGNTRLALAVVCELKLFYEEVLRRSIEINVTPGKADEAIAASDAEKAA